jgi:hypothetical protein
MLTQHALMNCSSVEGGVLEPVSFRTLQSRPYRACFATSPHTTLLTLHHQTSQSSSPCLPWAHPSFVPTPPGPSPCRVPATKPSRSMPTLTPSRQPAWPLNSSHALASATEALRCGWTLLYTPTIGGPNQIKCGVSSPTICPARGAVESSRASRALGRFRHAHAKMRLLYRALLAAVIISPTLSLYPPPCVDSKRCMRKK